MSKIKAIFVDFDWTIYDHNMHALNMSGIKALQKAKENGYKIILNSARTYYSLKGMDNILSLVDFDGFCCSNGLINLDKNKTISACYIDENLVKAIVNICNDNHISYLLSKDRISYLNTANIQRMDEFYHIFNEPRGLDINICDNYANVYAIQLFIEKDKDYLFDSLRDKLHYFRFCSIAVELQSVPKNKGDSLDIMMKHFNLKPDECVAIGDSDDDIKMFEKVKYGICMGNGTENAKNAAYYITDNIENDGLEKALKYLEII